ncbi:aldehyde dehydrogenase family protein [Rhizobium lusitanum]|uniref:Acyl-CoA reductase-like NAD-dependent aldehyde dehydrogenase n=1 Tax=Rhizobium lusitanum TaxID=293958 RepID=A0A7X0IT64_9HYPH|nr:aldehyde dehydrogenase family protein [Rhizobium lusitanum]MBB6486298.1 acyl-CoA reductase-like NAD-dependent aldehyde dehydrogenase [Rhizobium lusitanum]
MPCDEIVGDLESVNEAGSKFNAGLLQIVIEAFIHPAHLDKVAEYVEQGKADEAQLLVGGSKFSDAGALYPPTIFTDVIPQTAIAWDEIFGPVLTTFLFRTAEEAIRNANDAPYGRSGYVWSMNLSTVFQAIRRIKAGRSWINGMGGGAPQLAIGGHRRSGVGRELGKHGFSEYSELKSTHASLSALPV